MHAKMMYSTIVTAAIMGSVGAKPVQSRDSSTNSCPAPAAKVDVANTGNQPTMEKLVMTPATPPSVTPGDDLNLAKADSFYWVLPEQGVMANMTVAAKTGYRILNSHSFSNLVQKVDCAADDTIKVTMSSNGNTKAAETSWAWVNKEPSNTAVYIVDGANCGGQHGRQPYYVTSIEYDHDNMIASMAAKLGEWTDFIDDAEINIKGEMAPQTHGTNSTLVSRGLSKRLSKHVAIHIDHDFSSPIIATNVKGVTVGVSCAECKTQGTLDADISLSWKHGFQASVTARDNVALSALISLSASGTFVDPIVSKSVRIGTIGLPGLSIGGIVDIGPELTLDAKASLGGVSAKAEAKFGGVMSFANGQTISIGKGSTTIHPSFSALPPSLTGSVSVSGSVNPLFTLNVSALFLGKGVTGGVAVAAPILSVSAGAAVSAQQQTCANTTAAVNFAVSVGMSVDTFAGFGSPGSEPNKKVLISKTQPLLNKCIALV
ncbi:hypothetical protein VHEMI10392 [[Torrubiella] hemipterigena]|uniref:Uncharacterized protein n=1 Tax=[Torrubiella] hemipterigena TaxID=1531966 RepID=A0A0A1TRS0_9HYPO|nr:hypothetical protein VHEMI10392 [[Torrubiella] hemipterigena]